MHAALCEDPVTAWCCLLPAFVGTRAKQKSPSFLIISILCVLNLLSEGHLPQSFDRPCWDSWCVWSAWWYCWVSAFWWEFAPDSGPRLVDLGLLWGAMALTSSLLPASDMKALRASQTWASAALMKSHRSALGSREVGLLAVHSSGTFCMLGSSCGISIWPVLLLAGHKISHKPECSHERLLVSFGLYQN